MNIETKVLLCYFPIPTRHSINAFEIMLYVVPDYVLPDSLDWNSSRAPSFNT